ncbi:MAG: L,D-transpeptidase/peptidoglycan binding protein [Bacillota bacterium]|nr:L,D-transpeptidase/peptidoglycan binding protein [Bacillota bacterium]
MNHFYFGSSINCINVSGKTVKEAENELPDQVKSYILNLKERGGKTEQIRGADIELTYSPDGQVQNLKNEQSPFGWIFSFYNTKNYKITGGILYNKELLKIRLSNLSCIKSNNITEPKNPGFQYANNGYVITPEVKGNKINYEVLLDYASKSISKLENSIDLESINCYVNPEYNSSSQKVTDVKNTLNKYVSSKITYTLGEHREILDGSIINKWINIDDNLKVTFDEEKVKNYLAELSRTYDTVGKARNFKTSSGKTIKISGGDYGWLINTYKEAEDLVAAIKEGQTISKKPTYSQTAFSYNDNDIGNTYLEIDLTKQHLWFYKDGSLVVQGDVVTGNVSHNTATPAGIYRVKYKQKNAVLNGPDYSSPVTFWMPFNGGIGLHDASWRSVFGGNIYKTSGSHGCVNAPYYLAKTVFNVIEAGDPVVCYY